MHSPAAALAWRLWARHRFWLIAGLAYFVVVEGLCQVIPRSPGWDGLGMGLSIPLWVGLMALTAVFSFGAECDLVGQESGYPARMLILPLRVSALVGWPMLFGSVTIALAGLAMAQFVLRPRGIEVPLWYSILVLVAASGWVQALLWAPFPLPWLRLPAIFVAIGAVVAIPAVGNVYAMPAAVTLTLLALQVPVAYLVAVIGLGRARRGDDPDWRGVGRWFGRIAGRIPRRERPFASAAQAQAWLEWRVHGRIFVLTAGLFLLAAVSVILFGRHSFRLPAASPLRSVLLLLFTPMLAALSTGLGSGRLIAHRRASCLTPFLATRPMTSTDLVRAKCRTAAVSALVALGLAVLVTIAALLITGDRWMPLPGALAPLETAAVALLAVFVLVLATWRLLVANMAISLTGRP